jgi:TolB protein
VHLEGQGADDFAKGLAVTGRFSIAAQLDMPGGPFRKLASRNAQLRLIDLEDGSDRLVFSTDRLIEAPNWLPDGSALLLNGSGGLYRLDFPEARRLVPIDLGTVQDANNDHVISPDGHTLFVSAGGAVYAVSVSGGEPRQLSPDGPVSFFLHGVSPDGEMLACTTIDHANDAGRWGIQLLPVRGGKAVPLLLGVHPVDGPEWSPDGQWLWFNGELAASAPGHSQVFRMRTDGSDVQRMVTSSGVDWFPHPSPDGASVSFLRYPEGTLGHPADLPVELWLLTLADGQLVRLAAFAGGQGSINVNSWSPDSRFIAYVAYPRQNDSPEGSEQ